MDEGTALDRRRLLATGAGALGVLLAGCAGDGGGGTADGGDGAGSPTVVETTAVAMTGGQFDPRNVRVGRGATVTWTNDSAAAHTVTAASDNWTKDAQVASGAESTHSFDADGVYDVYCRFHGSADPLSGMSMKVAVGDATIDEPLGGDDGDDDGGGDDGGGIY